tara:strand:- start:231 stop:401 length:171 start_codon:yes stop_codon:yes gene_type:complete
VVDLATDLVVLVVSEISQLGIQESTEEVVEVEDQEEFQLVEEKVVQVSVSLNMQHK